MAFLFSNAVYCVTEHGRQEMNQRARAELEEILNSKEFRGQISQPGKFRYDIFDMPVFVVFR